MAYVNKMILRNRKLAEKCIIYLKYLGYVSLELVIP